MKTVIVFQGGGALGAFGAAAWQALQPALNGDEVIALAGTSIGAFNAALLAHRHRQPDHGAAELVRLWRDDIQTPPWPFFGPLPLPLWPSAAHADDWNGMLTGLVLGTRGLHGAFWPHWQPWAPWGRLQQPLHERSAMRALFERLLPPLDTADGRGPLLAVGATDVAAGRLRLFDSDDAPLGPRHLLASSAIPLLFDPVEVDGQLYWDGDIVRDSLLPLLFERLLAGGRLRQGEPVRLVTVEQFPRAVAAAPQTMPEILYRAFSLLQADKLAPPRVEGLSLAQWWRVVREPLPEDGVSAMFDYSPGRMGRVMAQGEVAVRRSLAGVG